MEKIRACFGFQSKGKESALSFAQAFRSGGFQITLLEDSYENCHAFATKKGMSHLLYFETEEDLLFSLLDGEMAGFTTKMRTQDLTLPQ